GEGRNTTASSSLGRSTPCALGHPCRILVTKVGLDQEMCNRLSFSYWQCIRPLTTRLANGSSIAFRLPCFLSGTAISKRRWQRLERCLSPLSHCHRFPSPRQSRLTILAFTSPRQRRSRVPDADHRLGQSTTS